MVCSEQSVSCEMMTSNSTAGSSSRAARRRRMEFRRVRIDEPAEKRRRFEDFGGEPVGHRRTGGGLPPRHVAVMGGNTVSSSSDLSSPPSSSSLIIRSPPHAREGHVTVVPKYGFASVCGRRRDMEDAVAIHPWFCRSRGEEGGGGDDDVASPTDRAALHYFGVYDGHGCSHVATKCRERLHDVVKEEIIISDENVGNNDNKWKCVMERSFTRMDKEVIAPCNKNNSLVGGQRGRNGGELPLRASVAGVRSFASWLPTAEHRGCQLRSIVVANCGDSRAVLCRNGRPVPPSVDHKPDRADELSRILAAGGRVIYWEGARVLGVLAMSRAIGDNYLKPYAQRRSQKISQTWAGLYNEYIYYNTT